MGSFVYLTDNDDNFEYNPSDAIVGSEVPVQVAGIGMHKSISELQFQTFIQQLEMEAEKNHQQQQQQPTPQIPQSSSCGSEQVPDLVETQNNPEQAAGLARSEFVEAFLNKELMVNVDDDDVVEIQDPKIPQSLTLNTSMLPQFHTESAASFFDFAETEKAALVDYDQQQLLEASVEGIVRTKSLEFLNQIFADQQILKSTTTRNTHDKAAKSPSAQYEDVNQRATFQQYDAQFQGTSGALLMPLCEDLLEAKLAKRKANLLAARRYRKRKAEAKEQQSIRVNQLEEKLERVKFQYDVEQKEYDSIITYNKELQTKVQILKLELNMAEKKIEKFRRLNSELHLEESNAPNGHMQYFVNRFPSNKDIYGWGHTSCQYWRRRHNHFM